MTLYQTTTNCSTSTTTINNYSLFFPTTTTTTKNLFQNEQEKQLQTKTIVTANSKILPSTNGALLFSAPTTSEVYFSASREIQNCAVSNAALNQHHHYFLCNASNYSSSSLLDSQNAIFDNCTSFPQLQQITCNDYDQTPQYYSNGSLETTTSITNCHNNYWPTSTLTTDFYNEFRMANDLNNHNAHFLQPFVAPQQEILSSNFLPYNTIVDEQQKTTLNILQNSKKNCSAKNLLLPKYELHNNNGKSFFSSNDRVDTLMTNSMTNSNNMACRIKNCSCGNFIVFSNSGTINKDNNNSSVLTKSVADSTTSNKQTLTTNNKLKKLPQTINNNRHFSCNTCDKIYCRKSTLKIHMKQHVGERPFICQVKIFLLNY